MTKAERIYKDTKHACKKHIEAWGFDNVGFNRMATEELVFKRTVNEIKKLIEKDYELAQLDRELKILNEKEYFTELSIIRMVEYTLENQYIA